MKIVVLGLPNKPTILPTVDKEQALYGYATQIGSVCAALHRNGHEVVHMGVWGSDVPCSKHIDVVSEETWDRVFIKRELSPNVIKPEFDLNTNHLLRNLEPDTSIVCVNAKDCHSVACMEGVRQAVTETCVGYALSSIWTKYRSFMSYALMHSYYGTLASGPVGQWYDRVIPPCFDTATFSFTEKKDDYFFMACRMVIGKGIHIAAQLAKKMGFKLKIAGPGDPTPYLIAPNIEYLGVLGPKDRNEVMCKAKALFSPSTYIEPFGMVVIEANLCGTPVITTDFGAFPENVIHGVSGYRCRTWAEFQFAVRNVDKLEPAKCRKWGENYSYEKVAPMYESYFQSLLDLNKDGWYSDNDPKDLSWLSKDYP